MSKLIVPRPVQSNEIKEKYAKNAYKIRECFRAAVVCQSIELSQIPENDRIKYLRSVLTSELSPKCKDIIEEKLYGILYSEEMAFEACTFKVDKGVFVDADTGCMVSILTKQVNGKLLIAAASCEATQQQNWDRGLTQVFCTIMDMTSDNLKTLLKAICVEEIEEKQKQHNYNL